MELKRKRSKKKKNKKNMINKEQVMNNIGSGWHSYIDLIYNMVPELSFCPGVYLIERKNGMLRVIFSRTDLTNSEQDFILKAIEYKIERLTARVCEECGQYGIRRKDLSEVKTLCTKCYAYAYSEVHPVPSLVAYPKPQIV
jgi:hypothetical protein